MDVFAEGLARIPFAFFLHMCWVACGMVVQQAKFIPQRVFSLCVCVCVFGFACVISGLRAELMP